MSAGDHANTELAESLPHFIDLIEVKTFHLRSSAIEKANFYIKCLWLRLVQLLIRDVSFLLEILV